MRKIKSTFSQIVPLVLHSYNVILVNSLKAVGVLYR